MEPLAFAFGQAGQFQLGEAAADLGMFVNQRTAGDFGGVRSEHQFDPQLMHRGDHLPGGHPSAISSPRSLARVREADSNSSASRETL